LRAGDLADRLALEADLIARNLLPDGVKTGREWRVGSLAGDPGQSLGVCIEGNKAGVWKDFSTGDAGDLLDLWMAVKGISLCDAMKEAKDYLGIVEDAPRLINKKRAWSKPVKPKCAKFNGTKSKVFDYLTGERKITKETLELFKVADGGDSIVFPYMRDGEPVMIKTLKLARVKGKKDIKPTSADQEPCLFGWQAVSEQTRDIILTEGEIDCMSIKQIGSDALSIPFGAGKGQNWIENEYDRIDKFDNIYISMDNDQAGEDAKNEIIERLGRHRCKILTLNGYKDANEALQAGFDIFDLQKAIGEAKTCDPEELRQLAEFHDEIMEEFYPKNEKQKGAFLPWSKTRDMVRLRLGDISVWAGINSHGKSVLLLNVIAGCVAQGNKACIASMEMSMADTGQKLYQQIGGVERPSPEYALAVKDFIQDNIWVFKLYGTAKTDRLIEVFKYAMHRYGIKHFVVDSLAKCGFSEDDYNGQKKFIDQMMEFAGEYNVHVHVVIHVRKQENENSMPGKFDVKGTGGLTDMVDNLFIVYRNKRKEEALSGTDEKKIEKYKDKPDTYLKVGKQRKTGKEPIFGLWYHHKSCQFIEFSGNGPTKYLD